MSFRLYVGGARSGKTRLAENWGLKVARARLMLATCHVNDTEMAARIALHKKARGDAWELLEEPLEPLEALRLYLENNPEFGGAVVIDSMGMWINNLMLQNMSPGIILGRVKAMGQYLAACPLQCALVSEECGLGVIAANSVARKFGDILGSANQIMGRLCQDAIFVCCGLPLVLKGKGSV